MAEIWTEQASCLLHLHGHFPHNAFLSVRISYGGVGKYRLQSVPSITFQLTRHSKAGCAANTKMDLPTNVTLLKCTKPKNVSHV